MLKASVDSSFNELSIGNFFHECTHSQSRDILDLLEASVVPNSSKVDSEIRMLVVCIVSMGKV